MGLRSGIQTGLGEAGLLLTVGGDSSERAWLVWTAPQEMGLTMTRGVSCDPMVTLARRSAQRAGPQVTEGGD